MGNIDQKSLPTAAPTGADVDDERAFDRVILTPCVLAWLGATISALLLQQSSAIPSLFCPMRTGCDTVLASKYAAVLGIPLALYGVGFYLTLLAVLLAAYGIRSRRSRERLLGAALSLSVIGAGFSAVLMFIQFALLRAFCPLCTSSALVSVCLVIACAKAERLAEKVDFRGRRAAALALAICALLSAAPHVISETSAQRGLLAVVDGQAFTRAQMEEEAGASLQTLQRAVYSLEFDWVRGKVEAVLLAAEAKKSNTTVPGLLAARMGAVKAISETEIDAHLASKGLPRTPETVRRIKDEILAENRERTRGEYIDELARNHHIEVFLKQPEVTALKIDLTSAKVSGPQDAKVQLVVFSDFECKHCTELSAVLKRARSDFPNDLMVAYRYFPIERHQRAVPAAVAAECAAEQGAFWEYHDRLYTQGGDLSDASLASIASALGLDGARFRECQSSPRARAVVEASRADAIASGLEGTPALFLNGKKIGGMIEYDNLARKIRDVLNGSAPATKDAPEQRQGDLKQEK